MIALVMPSQFYRPFWFVLLLLAVCSFSYGQSVNPPLNLPERAELKSLEIKDVKLFTWHVIQKKKKYVEVQEFRETEELHLIPSDKFDVECEVVGGIDLLAGDYFLWTTVDFLVAPVTCAYEQMDNSTLGSSVGWGQMTEMRDLKATPIYFFGQRKPGGWS